MMAKRRRPAPSANRPPPSPRENLLLAALPAEDYQRIAPTLEVVPSSSKTFSTSRVNAIQHVYFPGGGFCSMVTVLEDGGMVEVATIGREGMVGVSAVLDGHRSVRRDGAGRDGHLLPDDG